MLCNRLVEEADFRAAQELFGGQDLDKMQLKSGKDFEDFAANLAHKYVLVHSRSPHYKSLVKGLLKVSAMHLDLSNAPEGVVKSLAYLYGPFLQSQSHCDVKSILIGPRRS